MNLSRRDKQILSYISALIISLLCGTQYLFSVYSTSIADRLGFNSVQINTIGSLANYGLYLSAPLFGYIADKYPSRITPMLASVTIFMGFFCLSMTYEGYFESKSFILCAFYLLLTGIATSAAFTSVLCVIRANINSFRGLAFGAPFSLFGLTAFMFSQINSFFFKEDTYHFLLFVAITTGTFMFIGSILLIRLPSEDSCDETLVTSSPNEENSSASASTSTFTLNRTVNNDAERVPLLSHRNDIGGWELFQNTDAMSFGSVMFLIGGVGLMYINNVGIMVKLLCLSSGGSPKEVQLSQNLHVTLLSISSCFGRIGVGLMSDLAKYAYNLSRLWFLLATCLYVFIGQSLTGFIIRDLNYLWIGTIFIGFGFGNLFVISSTITSEWFGSRNFGLNWGTLACFAAFGGQFFNLLFGLNFDSQVNNCSGSNCYNAVFYISTTSCILGICIVSRLLLKRRERVI